MNRNQKRQEGKNLQKLAKKPIETSHVTNRTFAYKKGDVSLSFTLRVDIKTELALFKELLETAVIDIEEEIQK